MRALASRHLRRILPTEDYEAGQFVAAHLPAYSERLARNLVLAIGKSNLEKTAGGAIKANERLADLRRRIRFGGSAARSHT